MFSIKQLNNLKNGVHENDENVTQIRKTIEIEATISKSFDILASNFASKFLAS